MKRIGPGIIRGFYGRVLYVDENFDILAATVPGNNNLPDPVIRPGTGIPYAGFSNSGITEFPGHKEYDHGGSLVEGIARIIPHFHWSPTTNDAGIVKFFFEYNIVNDSTVISGTIAVTDISSGVAWQEQVKSFEDILFTAGLLHIGTQIAFRFYRDPSDPEDTYPATVVLHTAGWHYPVDSSGSIGVFLKYG